MILGEIQHKTKTDNENRSIVQPASFSCVM